MKEMINKYKEKLMTRRGLAAVSFMLLAIFLLSIDKEIDKSFVKNTPRNVRGVTNYKRSFPDKNPLHLRAAKRLGIKPISSRAEARSKTSNLVEIKSCDNYELAYLTHSIPYLVPKAANLLERIGKNFSDSLASKGLNKNKLVVTSVLRTKGDVKKLRRVNGNASANSAHCFATTFDISYKRYVHLPKQGRFLYEEVHEEKLKKVLSEVLRDLRKQHQCYIKYEVKQGCFHITAR